MSVCGTKPSNVDYYQKKNLTLAKAMDLALSMEAVEKNSRSVRREDAPSIKTVRGLTQPKFGSRHPQLACTRCGRSNYCKGLQIQGSYVPRMCHIAPACRSKPAAKPPASQRLRPDQPHRTNVVQQEASPTPDEEGFYMFKLSSPASTTSPTPIKVTVDVEGKLLTMEVDTGAVVSIISDSTRRELLPNLNLHRSNIFLKTYTDQEMEVVGQLHVHVKYGEQTAPLVLIVVDGNGPSLFGRNWLKYIKLDWGRITTVRTTQTGLN